MAIRSGDAEKQPRHDGNERTFYHPIRSTSGIALAQADLAMA
jgi:hypothetical protein